MTQYVSLEFANRLAEWGLVTSHGSTGDCFDDAAMESTWAAVNREVRHTSETWPGASTSTDADASAQRASTGDAR